MNEARSPLILVTGATGYIGGRLVPLLLGAAYRVRCLVRDATRVQGRPWRDAVEIIEGDALRLESLGSALHGVAVAYYLVHSLGAGADFHEHDVQAARNFGAAARKAGVGRIIYLGGLADPGASLSTHLRSRQATGDALRENGVPVTEFRAGVIVGAGSLSFEMIRYLVERLPVMICPRWVNTRVQPVAIRDVLGYLLGALVQPASAGRVIEIGGADVVSYGEMLTTYAEVRGLRRWLLPVLVLTPRLSSWWVHLVTPIPATIARPLIDGLRNEVVVRDDLARRLFPAIEPLDHRTAVRRALAKLEAGSVETSWSDALSGTRRKSPPVMLMTREGMLVEQRRLSVDAPAEAVFRAFSSLGGVRGWRYMNWAWRLRGAIDRLYGGVGLRRGRRHPSELRVGDALDFWRVEALVPGRLLRLRAEMKVPGKAWLEFEVQGQAGDPRPLLSQTAIFAPKGLIGHAYWYLLYPIHGLIFRGLVRRLSLDARLPTAQGEVARDLATKP